MTTLRKYMNVQCKVDTLQYERIKNLTKAKGFFRIADYLRHAALERDLTSERKFEEIHQALLTLAEDLADLKKNDKKRCPLPSSKDDLK